MATVEWTDARLTDTFDALRADIAASRDENRELRDEMHAFRDEMRAEMRALREDLSADMRALRADIHSDVRMLWVTLVACYVSFVCAFVVTQL